MTAAGTPRRSIRVPDDVWQRWQHRARRAGMSVSDLIRAAMDPTHSPAVADGDGCGHPRDRREVHGWGTICRACDTRIR